LIDNYAPLKGDSDGIKQDCLTRYVNGIGFHAIERCTGVHHTTVIHWVRQQGERLPNALEESEIPEIGVLDELETFVGAKANKIWI
jgi:transposase-like protein